jgi:hypothetical protein
LVQIILSKKEIQNCTNQQPGPLERGDNHKNAKIGWGHLKIFYSRTTKPEKLRFTLFFFKFVQIMVHWVWGGATIGKTIFTYVDIGKKSLKIFFSRTSRHIAIKIGTNSLVKGIQYLLMATSSSKRR